MPLSLDTILAQAANSGSFSGTSGSASLASATTAGNAVVIVVGTHGLMNTPSGFTSDGPVTQSSTGARVYGFRKQTTGGETSWTISPTGSAIVDWVALELQGLDPDFPVDVGLSATVSTTSGTTASSGTSPRSTSYDAVVLAVHAGYRSASTTAPTWSGHTNGFTELAEVAGNDGTNSLGMSVSWLATQQLGTQETTATSSITMTATNSAGSFVLVYSAAGAKREANIQFFWGFKVGAGAAGLGIGSGGLRYIETIVGSPTMTADGLQLASTSAAESAASDSLTMPASGMKASVHQVRFRFDSSLPSVDTDLFMRTSSGDNIILSYQASSQKLRLHPQVVAAEQLSAATVTAGTWYVVDLRIVGTTTAWTVDWQIDDGAGPVAQTQLAFTSAAALGSGPMTLGWPNAITVPGVTFAHALASNVAGHYPLGTYTSALLKADTSATPTVSGTVGNFAFITNNATGAALTSGTLANVPATIDEFPPTVGAAADGFCVATASATDYLEVPLETYALSGNASLHAARVVIQVWAAAASACTCKVQGWDGTTRTVLFPEADPITDNSSTPAWICKMWRPSGGWTQAKLDAAAIDYGAADATPDNGPLAVGMEILVKPGDTLGLFGNLASQKRDSVSGGVLAASATPPSGYSGTLHTENPGATDTAAPGGTTTTVTLDAPDEPTVNYVAYYPPPEDTPDA